MKLHANKSHENEEPLTYDEVLIVKVTPSHTQVVATLSVYEYLHTHQSALEMRDKTVADVMTPLESVFMLDINGVIDTVAMNEVPAKHLLHSKNRWSVG